MDIPLCWYSLDQITVLGDFYRNEISKGWDAGLSWKNQASGAKFPRMISRYIWLRSTTA